MRFWKPVSRSTEASGGRMVVIVTAKGGLSSGKRLREVIGLDFAGRGREIEVV